MVLKSSPAFLLILATLVTAQGSLHNVIKKSDVFWQLADLDKRSPNETGNVFLGGQNFTWCCLKAVDNALRLLDNGTLVINNNALSNISISTVHELQSAAQRNQFPCTAKYNADPRGAPEVLIQYEWFAQTCPGWSMSNKSNLNAWLHSLSGFLLPAVIFCLSVPRRRKLHIFRSFFVADLAGIKSYLPALLGAVGAGLIVTIDTIIWLSICFAIAGPMILSGLYEAMLDSRVLEFLREKIHNKRLTLDMRCRCLMLILIGNLDLELDSETRMRRVLISAGNVESSPRQGPTAQSGRSSPQTLPELQLGSPRGANGSSLALPDYPTHVQRRNHDVVPATRSSLNRNPSPTGANSSSIDQGLLHAHSIQQPPVYRPVSNSGSSAQSLTRRPTAQMAASPWRHMEVLLYDLRLYDDDDVSRSESPRQWPRHICSDGMDCHAHEHNQPPLPRTVETESSVAKAKTRLRTMLHCQYSFGSIVGAPVIFFLGGFIFAFLTSLDDLGDEDIASSLTSPSSPGSSSPATIPTSSKASSQPSVTQPSLKIPEDPSYVLGFLRFDLVYPSCYKVAWQWLRGHTKKQWIDQLLSVYAPRADVDFPGNIDLDDDMEDLRSKTTLSSLDWFLLLSLTLLLLGLPFSLAFFMTAFFTPQIGLSCRSLTFLVYFTLQLAQLCLWLWAYAGPPPRAEAEGVRQRGFRLLDFFRKDGWLDRTGFYDPSTAPWHTGNVKHNSVASCFRHLASPRSWTPRTFWCLLYYSLQTVFGLGAVFASLGGTLMQIMGVYRTNMCYTNAQYWRKPYSERPPVVLSVNSREMIQSAIDYWEPAAITAIVFMAVVSFVGWWYQRRMRDVFGQLVKKIDEPKFDRQDAKDRRPLASRAVTRKGDAVIGG
ncbi:hypothetical protein CMUS01_00256 [Colletotrichum musicola]|uniref:TRP C-terminal domain-containing protein n=1 Tax=Colletotrichum musicola TaxID=2175873 RepID=A0A8H6NZ74_9PEZI|nr:hypothetical protein CMUS01_00256 [Colletotrichum musicola]